MVRVSPGLVILLIPSRHVYAISSPVFLDENNSVKLGDFGLSKALPQASFANTYVGVRATISFPLFDLITNAAILDPILHVPRTDARKSLRLKIGYLVPRMPHIRTLRPQAPISRSKDSRRAEHTHKVCLSDAFSQSVPTNY